jgi:hypothetical protein
LAESPEELRLWELSIIDERVLGVPVDSSSAPPVFEPESTQSVSPSPALIPGMNPPMVPAGVHPPSISSSSTAADPHANNNPLPAATSLPARMCTVSHCHKILPGNYRYKRCEQHRLQNRRHSQLKRVREKEVKGVGPEKGAVLAEIPREMEVGGRADKDKEKKEQEAKQANVAPTTAGIEAGVSSTTDGGDSESQKIKSHDQVCLWFTFSRQIVLTALSFPETLKVFLFCRRLSKPSSACSQMSVV